MTLTENVIDFVQSATPSQAALDHAEQELTRFDDAARRGSASPATARLASTLGPVPDRPARAWLDATAATTGDAPPRWVAICSAARTVGHDAVASSALVEAVAIGYEVAEQISSLLGADHTERGWSMRSTVGAVAAGMAAGRLLGLTESQLRHLVGLCTTQAAGLAALDESTEPGLVELAAIQVGRSAATAVEAAVLSKNGFTSSEDGIGGRRGMLALMTHRGAPETTPDLVWAWR